MDQRYTKKMKKKKAEAKISQAHYFSQIEVEVLQYET